MGNAITDLLQGASNAAASNVSGPVDLFAAALRALGVPVPENALLGSKWMEERGLTKKPQNALMGLLGEAAGLSAPIAAAAKAPQIAAGLLKHADQFQAYNKALGPAGASQAVVWHGSPHKFDKFDSAHIGKGEGAQAYGHGLYLAESPGVAGSYAKMNPASTVKVQRVWPSREHPNGAYEALMVRDSGPLEELGVFASRAEAEAAAQAARESASNIYKVDLPDPLIARMLDWDKPLHKQSAEVQQAIKDFEPMLKAAGMTDPNGGTSGLLGKGLYEALGYAMRSKAIERGTTAGTTLQQMQDNSSRALRAAGIPGIRYLDSGSRGAGAGTSNFVVFPGEENALRILERNGRPLP
jgi:hypothetical protein